MQSNNSSGPSEIITFISVYDTSELRTQKYHGRTRAWRREQRVRKIRKRLDDIRNIFTFPRDAIASHNGEWNSYGLAPASWRKPGYYGKQKPIDCSCYMCSYDHYDRHKQPPIEEE